MLFELLYIVSSGSERARLFERIREGNGLPQDWEENVLPDHPSVSSDLRELVLSMTSENPDDRPTAEGVSASLLSIQTELESAGLELVSLRDILPENTASLIGSPAASENFVATKRQSPMSALTGSPASESTITATPSPQQVRFTDDERH